ncbi:uncharacterized protein LOC118511442 [Anopheles stephensi]|uniref:uncharacterized protein LOC118511442 n=1 Tax=Anopheles stephensi TaxID=30069 RepID=UPI0007D116CC|nr:uncharacterized protein LOC118511442 [Anopheles stephensi]
MMMTLEKMDTGSNGGLSVSGTGRHRRHAESSTPEPMDGFYIDIPTPSTRSVSPLSASVSPGKEKSFSFFKSVYRKISLKSNDEDLDQLGVQGDEDSRSSSVDSCSSISDRERDQPSGKGHDERKLQLQLSNLALSSASSDSGVSGVPKRGDDGGEDGGDEGEPGSAEGTKENRRKSRRSSVLRLLESLAINAPIRSRSLSCSNSSVNNLIHMKGRESRAESKCSLFSTNSANNGSSGNGGERISKESSKPPPKKILRRPVSYTYLRGISGLPTQRVPRSSICCSYYGR